jgi:predicted NBD/HSP70 family sugar kinase
MGKIKKHDQEYIKKQNKIMILNVIRNKRPISRADIAKITGMSPTSVGRIVSELEEIGLIKETELFSNGVGRKAMLLDIDAKSVLNVGVYLNRDITRIGIVDFDGNIIKDETIKYSTSGIAPEVVIDNLADYIEKIINESNVDIKKINGIGIGIPGIIDFKLGKVVFSAQLGWRDIDVASRITKKLNIRTTIDNTVKLKALAESSQKAFEDSHRIVLMSFGSGVGSALVIDGEIFRGNKNIAGEIGHTTVEPNGMLCECGRRGCLQTYIADSALIQEARKVSDVSSVRDIFDAANRKEDWAINILDMTATYISIAINNVLCMYNPDTVILGGRLIESNPEIIDLINEKCEKYIWDPFKGTFKLVYSKLKNDAVIIGAAALSLNTYLDMD